MPCHICRAGLRESSSRRGGGATVRMGEMRTCTSRGVIDEANTGHCQRDVSRLSSVVVRSIGQTDEWLNGQRTFFRGGFVFELSPGPARPAGKSQAFADKRPCPSVRLSVKDEYYAKICELVQQSRKMQDVHDAMPPCAERMQETGS